MADADAIVIGAGHNGLVAALRLALAGWRVLVLERSALIGGAMQTAGATLPGFRHDLYATNLSLFRSSLVYREHQTELEHAGLRFLACKEAYASVYEDERCVRIYTDPERTAQELARCSPADANGWQEAVALYRRLAPHLLPCLNMALPSRQMAWQLLRAAAVLRSDLFALRNVAFGSSRRLVERYFHSEEAKGVLIPWGMHLDFGPDVSGGAAFAFIAALSAHLNGTVLAEGGAGNVIKALLSLIESAGGRINTSTEVCEILVERGRAVGVRTATGETFTASRALVANVTPRLLFGRLLPVRAVSARVRQRAAAFRYGPGVFMIHLALSAPLRWRAAEDLDRFNYVHLNAKMDDVARSYAEALRGELPDRPVLIVGQPSSTDPSRAPSGAAVARIQVRAVPAALDWNRLKESYADRIVDQLARFASNAREVIRARHIMAPPDFERENPNLIGGDCVSGSHHLDQNYLARPFAGWSRYRTPVKRLWMVGASTWPGGGVNAASGYLAAEDILAG